MENKRFVLPFFTSTNAVLLEAEIRFIKNEKHKNFGKVRIYTNSHYEPLIEYQEYTKPLNFETAKKILLNLKFIEVNDDFNQYKIESLRAIKSKLPEKWIEAYKLKNHY